jgi:hypothetical protein
MPSFKLKTTSTTISITGYQPQHGKIRDRRGLKLHEGPTIELTITFPVDDPRCFNVPYPLRPKALGTRLAFFGALLTTAEGKALEALISNFMVYVIDNHGFTHPHLKGIPESIARLFCKDVLPSIKALGADGLSQREIDTELQIATHKAQILLQDCELQHQRLRGGIKDEYEAIKSGYSDLFGLLQDTEQIIESPLQALESNKARVPRP